ncbi:hypothetical protein [uncultured Microbacterium sp.]|uniref:hypothetical protein n=1 Tax=uncultured Microbacterium sp. TaxID=191216 RepID=UPI0025E30462|nr:hypothetical protein [uncultured Microbacterium sp.]
MIRSNAQTTLRLSSTSIRLFAGVIVGPVLVIGLAGCELSVPTDPDGTLTTVSGGELRVGVSPDPGLVSAVKVTPSGPVIDVVTSFSETIDAQPEWTIASEETLVGMLEDGTLDLAVGGFTAESPWTDRAGMTRGYTAITGADGREIVFLVPLGENAFLTALETFLDEKVGS